MPDKNWNPQYELLGEVMVFYGIDSIEKALVMIKALESLVEGGEE